MAGAPQRGLETRSLISSTESMRGKGVSRHYLPSNEIVDCLKEMTESMSKHLAQKSLPYSPGITWTTDTPIGELREAMWNLKIRGSLL